jgi:hypothetical protein
MTLEQMRARLTVLLDMRFQGVRSTTFEGRSVTYGSDAELSAAIRDLENRIEIEQRGGAKRSRVRRVFAVKDL